MHCSSALSHYFHKVNLKCTNLSPVNFIFELLCVQVSYLLFNFWFFCLVILTCYYYFYSKSLILHGTRRSLPGLIIIWILSHQTFRLCSIWREKYRFCWLLINCIFAKFIIWNLKFITKQDRRHPNKVSFDERLLSWEGRKTNFGFERRIIMQVIICHWWIAFEFY